MDQYLEANLSQKEKGRIFKKIFITPQGCWRWVGALDKKGYGLLWFRGRVERIHRVMYSWSFGPIPRGIKKRKFEQIDHLCNNPSCCNPSHLRLVTQRTNILRGNGVTAQCARKTLCVHGHELKFNKNRMRRDCPTCDSIRHKQRLTGPKREYWLKKGREYSKRWYNSH